MLCMHYAFVAYQWNTELEYKCLFIQIWINKHYFISNYKDITWQNKTAHVCHLYSSDRRAQSKYIQHLWIYNLSKQTIKKDNIFWLLYRIRSDWSGRCISFVTDYENILYSFTLGNNFELYLWIN